jgi:hypothetical protein
MSTVDPWVQQFTAEDITACARIILRVKLMRTACNVNVSIAASREFYE